MDANLNENEDRKRQAKWPLNEYEGETDAERDQRYAFNREARRSIHERNAKQS